MIVWSKRRVDVQSKQTKRVLTREQHKVQSSMLWIRLQVWACSGRRQVATYTKALCKTPSTNVPVLQSVLCVRAGIFQTAADCEAYLIRRPRGSLRVSHNRLLPAHSLPMQAGLQLLTTYTHHRGALLHHAAFTL